jgi:hypothetical protein
MTRASMCRVGQGRDCGRRPTDRIEVGLRELRSLVPPYGEAS